MRKSLYLLLFLTNTALAAWPEKPVRIVVTFPAGGPSDVVIRPIGQKLSEAWRQPVVVDNRGGAGGIVATEIVARAAPDGYNLLLGTAGGMTINPSLQPKLTYDSFRDFTPVIMVVHNPQMLVVHPSITARNVKEFVALARSRPEKITFASAGTGTATHLGLELLKLATGMDAVHVPYKGGAPATTDLIAGQVQALWLSIPSLLPHVKSGRLRALAVSTSKRAASAPDVPTVAESGYPGFEYSNWNALFAPAGTPAAVVNRINAAVASILNEQDIAQKLIAQGAEPAPGPAAELGAYMKTDYERWKKVITTAKLKAD